MENEEILTFNEEQNDVNIAAQGLQSETQLMMRELESYDKEIQMIGTTIVATLSAVNNAITSVANTVQYAQAVKLEIARLETQLDQFIIQSNNNLERFKSAMPVLEGQLNRISARIDKITDCLLETTSSSLEEKDLKRYSMQMDLLSSVNESFSSLLTKMLSL